MITRDQFEALVRAEAKRLFDTSSEYIDWHQKQRCERIYIAARMEHEWPLVEALQEIVEDLDNCDWTCARCGEDYRMPDTDIYLRATEALSPYTTKPTEP